MVRLDSPLELGQCLLRLLKLVLPHMHLRLGVVAFSNDAAAFLHTAQISYFELQPVHLILEPLDFPSALLACGARRLSLRFLSSVTSVGPAPLDAMSKIE
jgi:hypothetical protein